MSNVIQFKSKQPEYETVSENADVIDVVPEGIDLNNLPESGGEFQILVKNVLDSGDYEDFLLAIMDPDYYEDLDTEIRTLVDAYLSIL